MNPVLWILPGILAGAVESFLTKVLASRVLQGKVPVLLLCGKVVSYAAILVPVFFLLPRESAMWFGIGAGGGVLAAGLVFAVTTFVKEKR